MMNRFQLWLRAWAIALDQLLYVWLAAPKYLIVGGSVPSPYETISSKIGRMANRGHRWALILQPVIDRLFMLFGSPAGHCQRSIVRAATITASFIASGMNGPLDTPPTT
jgi:hypothetical protein